MLRVCVWWRRLGEKLSEMDEGTASLIQGFFDSYGGAVRSVAGERTRAQQERWARRRQALQAEETAAAARLTPPHRALSGVRRAAAARGAGRNAGGLRHPELGNAVHAAAAAGRRLR